MEDNKIRGLYFTQKLKIFAYNVKYKAIAYLQEYPLDTALQAYQTVYLLGKQFTCNPANVQQINKLMAIDFRSIIWITYRSGFPQLLQDFGVDSFVTDTGWGCMIRVGQMLFAQILRDYLQPKNCEEYAEICEFFNDFKCQMPFSIQRIARLGKKEFNLVPGQWYNPAQISYILSGFLNQSKDKRLSNLKSIVFNNASLFYDQLIEIFALNGSCKCKNKQIQQAVCEKCCTSNRKVALISLVRLGLDCPQSQYLAILNKMMSWKWFRGILGGKPQKALYFVGLKDDQYVYLDPHFVQTANEKMPENEHTYFCQSFRRCKNTSIDPSLGICFFLDSLSDLNEFYRTMNKTKRENKDFFIYMADETPKYMEKSKSLQIPNEQELSQEFQVIQ